MTFTCEEYAAMTPSVREEIQEWFVHAFLARLRARLDGRRRRRTDRDGKGSASWA